MLEGINIEEIKQYNQNLRAHTERASKLRAEIEFNKAELERACAELKAELGIEVTPENIETIYRDRVASINSTLASGKEILKRIADEENKATNEEALNAIVNSGEVIEEQPVSEPAVTQQPVVPNQTNDIFGNL